MVSINNLGSQQASFAATSIRGDQPKERKVAFAVNPEENSEPPKAGLSTASKVAIGAGIVLAGIALRAKNLQGKIPNSGFLENCKFWTKTFWKGVEAKATTVATEIKATIIPDTVKYHEPPVRNLKQQQSDDLLSRYGAPKANAAPSKTPDKNDLLESIEDKFGDQKAYTPNIRKTKHK